MKRSLILVGICLTVLFTASVGTAKDRKTSLSGTWECVAHGGPQGDMAFTLYLQQSKEVVDGSIRSPLGGTQISSGAIRKNELELHFDLPQGSYTLMGRLEKGGKIVGAWSLESDKGAWEGTKHDEGSK
jgi:hypothetical protein